MTQEDSKEILVAREEFSHPNGKNLYVIFMPWHAGDMPFRLLINRLSRRNAVLAYWFSDNIISPDSMMTRNMYQYVGKTVSERIINLTKKQTYGEVRFIGMSLGTLASNIAAREYKNFDHITLVCPGSFTKSLWFGQRTGDLRHAFEKNGMTLTQLLEDWKDIESLNNTGAFVGKRVKIITSIRDTHIPTVYQKEYITVAQADGVNPKIKKTIFGHYGTVIKYCLFGETFLTKDH